MTEGLTRILAYQTLLIIPIQMILLPFFIEVNE
jgi:hypothetical protein